MVFDDKTLLNESLNFDFGKNIHSENVRWYADYEDQPRNLRWLMGIYSEAD